MSPLYIAANIAGKTLVLKRAVGGSIYQPIAETYSGVTACTIVAVLNEQEPTE